VKLLKERFSNNSIIISTGFSGLDVVTMTDLRRALREKGLEYRVVKNNLAAIASEEAGVPLMKEVLQGPTGILVGYGDPVEPVQALTEYLRTSRIGLTIQGAVLGDRVLSPLEVTTLASLPPRPVLVAQLAGQLVGLMGGLASLLQAPAQRLASVLNSPSQGLVTVLQRHLDREQVSSS